LAVKDAEKHRHFSTIKKLIFKGANTNSKDLMSRKPIDFTKNYSDPKIAYKVANILS
jgi:hypothetical protein